MGEGWPPTIVRRFAFFVVVELEETRLALPTASFSIVEEDVVALCFALLGAPPKVEVPLVDVVVVPGDGGGENTTENGEGGRADVDRHQGETGYCHR